MRSGHASWSTVALAAVLTAGAMPVQAQTPTTTDTARTTQDTSRAARDRARDSTRRVTRSVGGEVVPRVTKDAPGQTRRTTRPTTTAPAAAPAVTDTTARLTPTPAPVTPMATPAPTPMADSTTAGPLDAARAAVAPILATMRTDAHAMALLHESNLSEIEAGRRAQREATDSAVRAFAARMVEDHTALDQQGTALAQRLNVTPALPDSALPQLQARELQALPMGTPSAAPSGVMRTDSTMRRPDSTMARPDSTPMARTDSTMARADTTMRHAGMMHGTAGPFDQAYVTHQVAAHARTLALVDAAIQRAQQAELRTTLETQVRPKVAEHLRMAQELQTRLGGR